MAYMERVEDFETEEEIMPNRLKLRRYLRELVSNQKRIHMITKAKAEPTLMDDDSEVSISEQVMVYLKALDHKIKLSETIYFDDAEEPKEETDIAIMREMARSGLGALLPPDQLPHLKKWHDHMKKQELPIKEEKKDD